MISLLPSLVLVVFAYLFAYRSYSGWRSGVGRFPLDIVAVRGWASGDEPQHFWAIMILNLVAAAVAFTAAFELGQSAFPLSTKPLSGLAALDGCYEPEGGGPEFMQPRPRWAFRVRRGEISDRWGKPISTIQLHSSTSHETSVTFSPGILVTDDEHKEMTVVVGPVVQGNAFLHAKSPRIRLADEDRSLMITTTCD